MRRDVRHVARTVNRYLANASKSGPPGFTELRVESKILYGKFLQRRGPLPIRHALIISDLQM